MSAAAKPTEPAEPVEPDPVEATEPVEPDDDTKVKPEDDWQVKSRKHEREAKALRKKVEAYEAEQAAKAAEALSEQEKAVKAARDEGRAEAAAEASSQRRQDKLESQVIRMAAQTFADADDAVLHLNRAITASEVDLDDLVDESGKVDRDAVKAALDDLLERKPHLKTGGAAGVLGSADQGAGAGAQGEPTTVEGELATIRQTK